MARFEVPEGWVVQAYRFALDPSPSQVGALASHAGAVRFAHNHMLALLKSVMDQRSAERSYGIDDESTRKLARRIEAGSARILSATVAQDSAGRWYCSFQTLVAGKSRPAHAVRSPHPVVGVDVDVGGSAHSLLVIATPGGTELGRVTAPKSLTAAHARLRALQRRAARQHGPYDPASKTTQQSSKRWRRTQARIGARTTELPRYAATCSTRPLPHWSCSTK